MNNFNNGLLTNDPESFYKNRDRVWETLSNLPIEKSDWRYDDLRKIFLDNWQKEIYRTNVYYVSEITDYNIPSKYYLPAFVYLLFNYNHH